MIAVAETDQFLLEIKHVVLNRIISQIMTLKTGTMAHLPTQNQHDETNGYQYENRDCILYSRKRRGRKMKSLVFSMEIYSLCLDHGSIVPLGQRLIWASDIGPRILTQWASKRWDTLVHFFHWHNGPVLVQDYEHFWTKTLLYG